MNADPSAPATPPATRPDMAVLKTARVLMKSDPKTYPSLPETLEAMRQALPGQPGRNTWLAYVNWLATGGAPDDAVQAEMITKPAVDAQIGGVIAKAAKAEGIARRINDRHQAQMKGTEMTTTDPIKALAEARRLFCDEHDLHGAEGIKAADAALRKTIRSCSTSTPRLSAAAAPR